MAGMPLDTAAAVTEECDSVHQQLVENNVLLEVKIQELLACLGALKKDKLWENEVAVWKGLHLSATETVRRQDKKIEKQKAQLEKERREREEERRRFEEERTRVERIRTGDQLKELEGKWRKLENDYEKDRSRFEQERRGFDKERKRYEEEQRGFDEERKRYEEEQRGFDEERKRYEEEQSKLISDIKTLEDQIRTMRRPGDLEERPRIPLSTDKRLNEALKDIENLKTKNGTLQMEVEGLVSDKEKLHIELKKQTEQMSTLIRKIDNLKLEIEGLKTEKGTLQLELEKLKHTNINVNGSMEKMELSNRELRGKVEDMMLEQEKAAQCNLATKQTLQSQLQLCDTKIAQLEEEVSNQRVENARVLEEVRMLKEQLADSEADRQALIREREALKDDLGTSGGKLIMAIKQREDVEETLKEYEGKCRNVEVVLKEYEEECTKLIADLYARNRGLQEVQKELLQQNEESKRKDSRLERLEKMRDALLEQVACLQAQLIVYRDERNRRAPAQEEQLGEQLQNRAKCKPALVTEAPVPPPIDPCPVCGRKDFASVEQLLQHRAKKCSNLATRTDQQKY